VEYLSEALVAFAIAFGVAAVCWMFVAISQNITNEHKATVTACVQTGKTPADCKQLR
jgi:hypothetical protein